MRLGILPREKISRLKGKSSIWLHTVSVGEAQAAAGLIKGLKQRYRDFNLVISTVTRTGNRIAQKLVEAQDLVIYLPLDIGPILRGVIRRINPRVFIVAETEIWPNLINNLNREDVSVALVNGRVSQGSYRGYRLIRPFFKRIIRGINLFCMQTEPDAQRIISLGADSNRVKVTGNMKFDIAGSEFTAESSQLGLREDEQLFIAGSTHPGEEEIILQVYEQLLGQYPGLRLLLAPRHTQRTKEIEKLVSRSGFSSERISRVSSAMNNQLRIKNPILILDTIGQLKPLYELADLVFIGGSLVKRGGQNPIEPAVFSKAIIFGPYMDNFLQISRAFLQQRAAIMVRNRSQLKQACIKLLSDSDLRQRQGRRAKKIIEEHKGATSRNLELITGLINKGRNI